MPAAHARRYREKKKADADGREEFLCKEAIIASESITLRSMTRWQTNKKSLRTNRKAITEAENAVGTPLQSPPYAQQPVESTPACGSRCKRVRMAGLRRTEIWQH